MRIRFGLHLDGLDPTPLRTAIGEATVGPLGLIGILETDLGLPPVLEHPAEQLITYRGILDELDTPERFYHRSFAVDPINVARTLMDWREQWYAAGWGGQFPSGAIGRLQDMADIETLAQIRVQPCVGQRVQRVLVALDTGKTQIEHVVLCDEPDSLPATWRELLMRLGYHLDEVLQAQPGGSVGTDLHIVQQELLEIAMRPEGEQLDQLQLAGDDSFIVVRAVSRDVSGRAMAEMLRESPAPSDTVVLAEHDGIIFDNALERTGLPRCGFQHYSRFRAVSQVLKLCIALLWEPVSPHLLLQFLIHPLGPLPRGVRSSLAEAVGSQPGIGGTAWVEALQTIEARERAREGATDARVAALRQDIDYWLRPQRFDPTAGAAIDALMERAQRCEAWLNGQLAVFAQGGERAMYGAAMAQAQALQAALERLVEQGRSTLPKIELDRLLDEVTRQQPDANTFAEANHVRATTHPGAITQTWPQVIWWDMAAQRLEFSYPWSAAELAELRGAGVGLPLAADVLGHRASAWLRPIVNASRQLILVVHDSDAGQHPLWSQLTTRFTGWSEVRVEENLLDASVSPLPHLGVATQAVTVTPLPGMRRWWELPDDAPIAAREVESFSSLSKLFYHPHEWVMQYPARLRSGRAADVADEGLLYGSLAHRLFENFFQENPQWLGLAASELDAWLNASVAPLIQQEGAVLLEPGRGVDRQFVSATLERALHQLLAHLRAAKVISVVPEHHETQPYLDVSLRGDLDLLVTTEDGRELVIDAKWGGERYRAEELEANAHLQLATYAYMRKTATGANEWPYPAYFIVTTGNMLAPDAAVFPQAMVHAPEAGGEGIEQLWARGEASYHWRRQQLNDRHIEVNAEGTEPTERSAAPEEALDNSKGADRFDDFTGLTGWGEFS